MPAAFFGHGSPMNALEHNRYTKVWSDFGANIERPRAILMISAHWYVDSTALTAMEKPKTIHDFYGFPKELFEVEYPAPGDPEIALEIAEIVKPTSVVLDRDSWGIDHGAWSILIHAFPEADIPVIQLSINANEPFDFHLQLGAKLAPLRKRQILIIASGNVVHNLGRIDWSKPEGAFEWTRSFDQASKTCMTTTPSNALSLREHPDYSKAAPTPDHFIPLLYLAGLAGETEESVDVLVEGFAFGSLSMTSYGIGTQNIALS